MIDYEQNLLDQQSDRELVAHDENLKTRIENDECGKCGAVIHTKLNPRNITFDCSNCGWQAIYPIATIRNSENYARKLDETDLILIARNDVIEKAKPLKSWLVQFLWRLPASFDVDEFIRAVTLLESREGLSTEK